MTHSPYLSDILNAVWGATAMYIFLIFIINVTGKRSTSRMNNFDWIVAITVGALNANAILHPDVSLFQGMVGMTVLFLLQYFLTKMAARHAAFRNVIYLKPTLLFWQDHYVTENLQKARVNQDEIREAVRIRGIQSMEKVGAVILEANGILSVIEKTKDSDFSILGNLKHFP